MVGVRGLISIGSFLCTYYLPKYIQWTLEIVDLDIVDSLVLVDKIVLTIYDFMK